MGNSVPKREKIAASRLQPANCATFLHVGNPAWPCVMHHVWSLAPARACSSLLATRMRVEAESTRRRDAELVSEFRKYSQGGERIGPKFATLRAKCGEIQSEKFGRFVSERTVEDDERVDGKRKQLMLLMLTSTEARSHKGAVQKSARRKEGRLKEKWRKAAMRGTSCSAAAVAG